MEAFAELSIWVDDGVIEKDTNMGDDVTSTDGICDLFVAGEDEGWARDWRVTERKYLVFAGGTRRVSSTTEKVSRRRHEDGG